MEVKVERAEVSNSHAIQAVLVAFTTVGIGAELALNEEKKLALGGEGANHGEVGGGTSTTIVHRSS